MKYKYWVNYSLEDFNAYILKAPADISAEEIGGDYEFQFTPFSTLKEARKFAIGAANGDIEEIRGMKDLINAKPITFTGEK